MKSSCGYCQRATLFYQKDEIITICTNVLTIQDWWIYQSHEQGSFDGKSGMQFRVWDDGGVGGGTGADVFTCLRSRGCQASLWYVRKVTSPTSNVSIVRTRKLKLIEVTWLRRGQAEI